MITSWKQWRLKLRILPPSNGVGGSKGNQEAVATLVGAGRVIWQLRDVLLPLRGSEDVEYGRADPLDSVIHIEVPHPGCFFGATSGQDPTIRVERNGVGALQELLGFGRSGLTVSGTLSTRYGEAGEFR
jgi:hypothetical protein